MPRPKQAFGDRQQSMAGFFPRGPESWGEAGPITGEDNPVTGRSRKGWGLARGEGRPPRMGGTQSPFLEEGQDCDGWGLGVGGGREPG